jgi:hypothetical protein
MITAAEATAMTQYANTTEFKVKCVFNDANKRITEAASQGMVGCHVECADLYADEVIAYLVAQGFGCKRDTYVDAYYNSGPERLYISWDNK